MINNHYMCYDSEQIISNLVIITYYRYNLRCNRLTCLVLDKWLMINADTSVECFINKSHIDKVRNFK